MQLRGLARISGLREQTVKWAPKIGPQAKVPEFGLRKPLFKGKSSVAVNAVASLIACIWQSRQRSLRRYGKAMALLPAIIEL